ncbi:glycosyltransferase [Streptomyces sp. NPDC001262]|uniref:glycosyltransferase n=1 Tax=unclassified Streptomyces TaxID=2593676 RepID=UPI00368E1340
MARFLLSTLPAAGCVAHAQVLAAALVSRGHEVVWHTGGERAELVASVGARFEPFREAASYEDLPPVADAGERGFTAVNTMMRRLVVDRAAGQLADYRRILARFPADVVISDGHCLGARLLHELGGPPWAVLNESALVGACPDDPPFATGRVPTRVAERMRNRAVNWTMRRVMLHPLSKAYRELRRGVGLSEGGGTAFDALRSPFLHLQPTSPAFEYPRRHLPPQIHLIGPMVPPQPPGFRPPAWWHELRQAPSVVHITQGTTATRTSDLVGPAIEALAGHDGLVVVTVAGAEPPPGLPDNVRFSRYIPYQALLPHVDVMVTNAGYSGVHLALANGVPMVAAGTQGDHREICARIEWSGVGVWLRQSRPDRIAAAVARVLDDPAYRNNARRIQRDFARQDAGRNAAALLERLAATGKPVLGCRVRSHHD